MEDSLHQFTAWCADTPSCALHGKDALAVWDDLLSKATAHPLPTSSGATVTAGDLRAMTAIIVHSEPMWPRFAQSLAKAQAGDASGLTITPGGGPPTDSVMTFAMCADSPLPFGYHGMGEAEAALRESAPRIGWLIPRIEVGKCAELPATDPPHPIHPSGIAPVLLVNGIHDYGTPPAFGKSIAAKLPGAVWFGADAGHAVYAGGNRCARDTVNRYFIAGTMPAPGEICPAGPDRS